MKSLWHIDRRVEKNPFLKKKTIHLFFLFFSKNLFYLKEARFCSFFTENRKTPF